MSDCVECVEAPSFEALRRLAYTVEHAEERRARIVAAVSLERAVAAADAKPDVLDAGVMGSMVEALVRPGDPELYTAALRVCHGALTLGVEGQGLTVENLARDFAYQGTPHVIHRMSKALHCAELQLAGCKLLKALSTFTESTPAHHFTVRNIVFSHGGMLAALRALVAFKTVHQGVAVAALAMAREWVAACSRSDVSMETWVDLFWNGDGVMRNTLDALVSPECGEDLAVTALGLVARAADVSPARTARAGALTAVVTATFKFSASARVVCAAMRTLTPLCDYTSVADLKASPVGVGMALTLVATHRYHAGALLDIFSLVLKLSRRGVLDATYDELALLVDAMAMTLDDCPGTTVATTVTRVLARLGTDTFAAVVPVLGATGWLPRLLSLVRVDSPEDVVTNVCDVLLRWLAAGSPMTTSITLRGRPALLAVEAQWPDVNRVFAVLE